MGINEKDQQIEKCENIDFYSCSINYFCETPYEKDQKIGKRED